MCWGDKIMRMGSRKISKAKVQHFFDEGYLILPRVFGRDDLEPLKREMAEQVGQAARRLADAKVHNGCMKILPRSHRRGVIEHHTGGNANFLVIQDEDLPEDAPAPVTAECPQGGVVLMTNLTPHCSTPNYADHVRWSVD